ncbi:hypothetical protein EGH22_19555 [Halomicroarcula sp. F28]|uniref:hypothetical protein n=1 Tax=Haloarcula salinisoli TaxID=2487746 RepID=UPI001C73D2F8|nr:hypothetical protein [Halomicroarcula salinisoli]MBX0288530.1 hypothetical protein [Halomicroarcula salinisoli]
MSETPHISIYPDNIAQKQRIEAQADKHDTSVSEYCLMAIEQQIAREAEAERIDDLDIESRLDELQTDITAEVSTATDINTQQESLYGIALWELLGSEFSGKERTQALKKAPATLEEELEGLAEKEGGDT